jgi:recombination protein RecT
MSNDTPSRGALAVQREETGKFALAIKSPEYQQKFKSMLPNDVSTERFTAVVLRAVQEDPDLLKQSTDKTSLFLACQRAAQDGLIPDKREGALVMYGNKVQWQPMIGGLRKVLAKHGFDLRAECVYENDTFDYDLGDDPRITHKAPPLGVDRGKIIGAYAIAKHADGRIYREVMGLQQLEDVRGVSRAKNSGPWAGPFKPEMYRKTVGRRLVKQLPLYTDDAQLKSVLESDDAAFDMDTQAAAPREPSEAAKKLQEAARAAGKPAKQVDTGNPEDVGAGEIDGDFTEVTEADGGGDQAEF